MIPESTALFLRVFGALCYSFSLGYAFRRAWSIEHGREYSDSERVWGVDRKDRLTYVVTSTLLFPVGIALIFAGFIRSDGWRNAPARLFCFGSDLMLTMSVYYLLMLLLMPLLRQRVSARACATAWLLPTYLYYIVFLVPSSPMPRVVFYCPARLIGLLVPVWFTGFVLFFTWHAASHLRFRRRILREASDEEDEAVLAVWQQEMQALNLKTPIRLIRCESASTPFSMTYTWRTFCTVLPTRPYTKAELRFIFRHELHHIQRSDIASKFFFAFLCSLFWFHPLCWAAARESAKDLELSCDEIVLEGEDDAGRRLYAELLLQTAGESRGFTTCLSADTKALRYRLKHVMNGHRCPPGTKLLIALLAVCFLCHGMFAFSDERDTLDRLFAANGTIDHFLYEVYDTENGSYRSLSDADLKTGAGRELLDYLSSLSVEHLIGSVERSSDTPEHSPRLYFSDAKGTLQGIWLYDGGVTVLNWYQSDRSERCKVYYVREKIDWEKIAACFE